MLHNSYDIIVLTFLGSGEHGEAGGPEVATIDEIFCFTSTPSPTIGPGDPRFTKHVASRFVHWRWVDKIWSSTLSAHRPSVNTDEDYSILYPNYAFPSKSSWKSWDGPKTLGFSYYRKVSVLQICQRIRFSLRLTNAGTKPTASRSDARLRPLHILRHSLEEIVQMYSSRQGDQQLRFHPIIITLV